MIKKILNIFKPKVKAVIKPKEAFISKGNTKERLDKLEKRLNRIYENEIVIMREDTKIIKAQVSRIERNIEKIKRKIGM